MIEGNGTALAENAFEDAIEATVYMATVHVREGELALPERIRGHLADGPVVVHLMRGEDDVAVHEATLTSRSTLTGITWPEDVLPRTSLTVLCPRGGASHDIGVLLPDPPDAKHESAVDDEDEDLAAEAAQFADDVMEMWHRDDEEPAPVDTSVITNALAALADAAPVADVEQPGPAEYRVPSPHPRTEQFDAVEQPVTGVLVVPEQGEPEWPGAEDSEERTDLLPAVVVPDLVEDDEPGTVFSAALVAVRTPPRRAGWLERRVRELARLVLDRSWTATRVIVATASGLVLAGAGLGYAVQVVFQ